MTDVPTTSNDSTPTPKKQRISNDDLYRNSTQFELWSFTQEELLNAKKKVHEKGLATASENFDIAYKKAKNENPEIFAKYPQEFIKEEIISTLTQEEEAIYLDFYVKNTTATCNHFKMPTQVRLTAASFFKKFYLVNSVMQYHPKNILYTCIFLAAKSENYFISIEKFVNSLQNLKIKDILDLEFIVLKSLKFTLLVHHPIRPLYGFFLDFQAELLHPSPIMYDVSVDTIGNLYNKAKEWLNQYYMLSDTAFLYTPPQIALAAMYDVDKRITDKYLKRKFLKEVPKEEGKDEDIMEVDQDGKEVIEVKEINGVKEEEKKNANTNRTQYETLVKLLRKCAKIAKDLPETDRERSKDIDKKCYFALHPAKLINKKIKKLTNEQGSAAPN
ncbi:uncharacterized protein KGF55_004616 [Candida pseudojiufengensis]|uniref:uncharacterized protein n=1 Tax=Candida pseudojiufengensis TaxID=497109 RepID=UPI0022255F83|nr:uncharacterized protein KGF55_004616 [Candida pseudojiufengensis]KAI5960324.1 hypothetical protein KGF55_004616 [Candida pseudojiufengensis]